MKKLMVLSLSLFSALPFTQGQSGNPASQQAAAPADRMQVVERELLQQRQQNQDLREQVKHLQELLQQQTTPSAAAISQDAGHERDSAGGQRVLCPIDLARTEITTPLPAPWWNTPQVGKLLGVDIEVIGGEKTLVCQYWAYGHKVSVMRHFPEGTNQCSIASEGNSFSCQ